VSAATPTPDYGEVRFPGFVGRLLRRSAKIVREANFAAALATLPSGTTVERTDSRGRWIAFRTATGKPKIRFRALEAWLAAEPTILGQGSEDTAATIRHDGIIFVYEGLHRTRATARERVLVKENVGGVWAAPGWLDFNLRDEFDPPTPSTRAIMNLFGEDPDAPPVPAR
jgi:hypothetical protein